MRKTIFLMYSCIIAAFLMECWACNKVLDIPSPVNKITADKIFSDSALLNQAVLNMDAALGNYEGNFTPLSGLYTDELKTNSTLNYYTDYFNNSLLSDNSSSYSTWQSLYSAIYQCNFILEGIDAAHPISSTFKDRVRGEALFIRSYAYLYLANIYGDCPLILTTNVDNSSASVRSDSASVYLQIIADLEKAKTLLLEVYPGEEKVRPSKWAASALLARTYLYVKNYTLAELNATAVINSNLFSIATPVNTVFIKENPESIYEIWSQNGVSKLSGLLPSSVTVPPVYYLSAQLVSSFETGDNRKTAWLLPVIINGTTYYCFNKYKKRSRTTGSDAEYTVLLRLAEQYLIRAEARLLQNNLSGAIDDLNSIRTRAGLPVLASSLNQIALLQAIQQERKIELYTENGHRFFDLKRWGIINQVLGLAKPKWDMHDQLYPIPLNDRKINPNLTQNSGYN